MRMKTCDVILFAQGEEYKCPNVAIATVDAGTDDEFAVCAKCVEYCHDSRINEREDDRQPETC